MELIIYFWGAGDGLKEGFSVYVEQWTLWANIGIGSVRQGGLWKNRDFFKYFTHPLPAEYKWYAPCMILFCVDISSVMAQEKALVLSDTKYECSRALCVTISDCLGILTCDQPRAECMVFCDLHGIILLNHVYNFAVICTKK